MEVLRCQWSSRILKQVTYRQKKSSTLFNSTLALMFYPILMLNRGNSPILWAVSKCIKQSRTWIPKYISYFLRVFLCEPIVENVQLVELIIWYAPPKYRLSVPEVCAFLYEVLYLSSFFTVR